MESMVATLLVLVNHLLLYNKLYMYMLHCTYVIYNIIFYDLHLCTSIIGVSVSKLQSAVCI